MDHPIPAGLEFVLCLAAAAIVAFVAVAIPLLFQLRRQFERFVASIERLENEAKPLAQETRALVDGLQNLSNRANDLVPAAIVMRLLRAGVGTFLGTLWNRRREPAWKERTL